MLRFSSCWRATVSDPAISKVVDVAGFEPAGVDSLEADSDQSEEALCRGRHRRHCQLIIPR
jgi:hypothetical protein